MNQVADIKNRLAEGMKISEIAKYIGCSYGVVSNIKRGLTWT